MSNTYAEAEALYGHPLQYAMVGGRGIYVGDTENTPDDEVRRTAEADAWMSIERYNRCPTCEQWSPCDLRKAM